MIPYLHLIGSRTVSEIFSVK